MKKLILGGLILASSCSAGYAVHKKCENCDKAKAETVAVQKMKEDDAVKVSAKSAVLMDADSGKVLFNKDENKRLPIASVVKTMTLLLAFNEIKAGRLNPADEIVCSETASGMGGSQVFLEANGVYKVADLLKAIVISSGNDASVAIAEKICGSESEFVNKMNEEASRLGLTNTNFANCTGLPAPNGYSTSFDVAKIFSELIKHKEYFKYTTIWLDEIKHPKGNVTELANTNKLVRFYNGCDAGKTGSTSEAGFCLAATSKRGELRLVSVVLGADTGKVRFKESSDLFDYGFGAFENKQVIKLTDSFEAKVKNGKVDVVRVSPSRQFNSLTKKGSKIEIKTDVKMKEITAPKKAGDKVGEIIVTENGEIKATIDLTLMQDLKEKNYFEYIKEVLDNR